MNLSRYTIEYISSNLVQVPDESVFLLPEKVLQFGSGEWLRALPDYIIDKANQRGLFNGRIVVVESAFVDIVAFDKQDCLYTICVQSVDDGNPVSSYTINASISRVLQTGQDWQQVLECAHNPEMKVIISHSTDDEIGLVNDDVRLHPPRSFPGKLLAFLYERFKAFGGSSQSGMVILPIEQERDNGRKLEAIVFELAHLNGLEDEFIDWLESSTTFCNSLAQRKVPGVPDEALLQTIENILGYRDELMVVADSGYSWVIEGDETIKTVLSFANIDNIVIEPSLERKGLRSRMLSGEMRSDTDIATEKDSVF